MGTATVAGTGGSRTAWRAGNLVQSQPGLVPRSRPMCQYPARPQYVAGDPTAASSFVCNRRVTVDVKPDDSANGVNTRSNGRLAVAILSDLLFDARRRWTSRR
jgi:hypothetical protein